MEIKGVNRKDIGKDLIPELGYSLTLIGNEDDGSVILRINCGVYSPWVKNCCSIEFSTQGESAQRILQASTLSQIAKKVIEAWQPEHGVITSHRCSGILNPKSHSDQAGWITYLPKERYKFSALANQIQAEAVENGYLVISTNDRFSSDNPVHVSAVKHIFEMMV